jgi:hypothetical protein
VSTEYLNRAQRIVHEIKYITIATASKTGQP